MPLSFSEHHIAASFSSAADSYTELAIPQKRMAERLAALLPTHLIDGAILDLCCGTGLLTEMLHRAYPSAEIHGLDIAPGMIDLCRKRWAGCESLSFCVENAETYTPAEPYAAIASNCGFQWFENPTQAVANLADGLKPGGVLAISVPVAGSIPELRQSYQQVVGRPMRGIEFLPPERYVEMIDSAGLHCKTVHEDRAVGDFPSARAALEYFKYTGTTFHHHDEYTPLSVAETRQLLRYYEETFGQSGVVPVTYEMLYVVAES
jgi:malonyl-CoA O-methyltransferase